MANRHEEYTTRLDDNEAYKHRLGKTVYTAALRLANSQAGLTSVVTVRVARGVLKLPALQGFTASEMWLWIPETYTTIHHGTYPIIFEASSEDLLKTIDIVKLAKETVEVQRGDARPEEISLRQYFMIKEDDAEQQAIIKSDIPLVHGLGIPRAFDRPPDEVTEKKRNTQFGPIPKARAPDPINLLLLLHLLLDHRS